MHTGVDWMRLRISAALARVSWPTKKWLPGLPRHMAEARGRCMGLQGSSYFWAPGQVEEYERGHGAGPQGTREINLGDPAGPARAGSSGFQVLPVTAVSSPQTCLSEPR